MIRFLRLGALVLFLLDSGTLHAGSEKPLSPEEQYRAEQIAQFTATQEAMNWPEKFDRIGNEMGVPPDILAAVAFTETRWEQLTWPAGETVSPDTGAPRPYGVMSLWDNDILGHSLIDAAALMNSTPEALKEDPEQNIRGAAALLKKYYDSNPLPGGTTKNDIESWQNAIVMYSGLKDPWLAYHHTVNCYIAMNQGYDQYGMHWKPHAVKLEPMREKLRKLQAEYDARINHTSPPMEADFENPPEIPHFITNRPAPTAPPIPPTAPPQPNRWPWFAGAVVALMALLLFIRRRPKSPARL